MGVVQKQFRLNHHLRNPDTNEVYCYVAKAGCSFFKTGFIADYFSTHDNGLDAPNIRSKVHNLARDFRVESLLEIQAAYSRVIIVRDPWERLVSAFLDKFINLSPTSFSERVLDEVGKTRSALSMSDFVSYLAKTSLASLNEHWMPQVEYQVAGLTYDVVALHRTDKHPLTARWAKAAGAVRRNALGARGVLPGATWLAVSEIESVIDESGMWPSVESFEIPPSSQFQERYLTPDRALVRKGLVAERAASGRIR